MGEAVSAFGLGSAAGLAEHALITGGLLGRYDPPSGRIELYPAILDALAPYSSDSSRAI